MGGILKQCIHDGFGLQTFGERLTGPEYAEHYEKLARELKIEIKLNTFVLDLSNDRVVQAISPDDGMVFYKAKAVILAMGCREKTRSNIMLTGERPAGVYTAGLVQRLVNIDGFIPGKEAVILGSGDIGLIMARRLTLEGVKVKGVYEIMSYSSGLKRNIVQCLDDMGIPLKLSCTVVATHGKERLEGVTIADVDEKLCPIRGTERFVECDTLLLSIGLIPENELAQSMGVSLDSHTKGPDCDGQLMTDVEGIFSCGNALHVNDLVDFVSESGEQAGKNAALYSKKERRNVRLNIGNEFQYLVPQRLDLNSDNSAVTMYFRSAKVLGKSTLRMKIDGEEVWKRVYPFLRPPEMQQIKLDFTKYEINENSDVRFEIEVAE